MQESLSRWFDRVKRRGEEFVGKRVMEMKAEGARERGRPRRRWLDGKSGPKSKKADRGRSALAHHKHPPHIKVGKDGKKKVYSSS